MNVKNEIEPQINKLINKIFVVLLDNHKKLLVKYLLLVVIELSNYYYNEKFTKQLLLNNERDLTSLLVLLIPYYKLETSNTIRNLNEIINGNIESKKLYDTTFYEDHSNIELELYFENSFNLIKNTFFKTAHRLMPNWITIFPYKLEDYNKNELSQNLKELFINKTFEKDNLKIQYSTLFGCCSNFLYNDIKTIKYLIYNVIDENETIPLIIYFCELLDFYDFSKTFENLTYDERYYVMNKWNVIKTQKNIKIKLKSILFFFLMATPEGIVGNKAYRYKSMRENLENEFINFNKTNDFEDDADIYFVNDVTSDNIISDIINLIQIKDLFNFIQKAMQQFRYTFYGFLCMKYDEQRKTYIVKKKEEYFNFMFNFLVDGNYNKNRLYYITPKMFYNYFKNLVCASSQNLFYIQLAIGWDGLDETDKNTILERLNENENYNFMRNVFKKLYFSINKDEKEVNTNYTNMSNYIYKTDIIPKVIYYCLCINGILTTFNPNFEISDDSKLPNKNTDGENRKRIIKSKIRIEGFNYITNMPITEEQKTIMLNSQWYNLFSANWICQLQQYHHFIHNRVMITTGGTGAGKSTLFPLVMLYAHKAINFNNNAKVYCTEPRIAPTTKNASRINNTIGFEYKNKKYRKPADLNYIQFSTGDEKIIDEDYHPCIRFYTDKSLIPIITKNYILKIKTKKVMSKINIADMILIDESHENSTNMTILLTILKFACYINNSITLGIISATMEYDEIIYRKYYQCIDDNYKYPLEYRNSDRKLMDRRIHLSEPFGDTNYEIVEYYNFRKFKDDIENTMSILQDIFKNSDKGDILIFQNGEGDISKLVKYLNSSDKIPNDVYAIPFYASLSENNRKIIEEIQEEENRIKFRNPKNYDVFEKIPEYDKVSIGTYKRFIIVSTNIAEASITIGTLSYVIDNGTQKKSIYDIHTLQTKLNEMLIAHQNRKQRKGRVGRVKRGFVYYNYDINILPEIPLYGIRLEDLYNIIFELYTFETTKYITQENDPYLITNVSKLPPSIGFQYKMKNELFNFYPKIIINEENSVTYPYSDGKYDSEQLIDNTFKFYITHPNEKNQKNKMEKTFEYLESMNLITKNENGLFIKTLFGENILKIKELYDKYPISITDLFCMFCIYSKYYNNKQIYSRLIHLMCVKIANPTFKIYVKKFSKNNIKNEFKYKSELIPEKLYTFYDSNLSKIIYSDKISPLNNINVLDTLKIMYERDKTKEGDEEFNEEGIDIKKEISNVVKIHAEPILKMYESNFGNEEDREENISQVIKYLENYYYYYILFNNFVENPIYFKMDIIKPEFVSIQIPYEIRNDVDKIFECLMIFYFWMKIVKKQSNNTYLNYFFQDVNNVYTLSPYSNIGDNYKNTIMYLNENDAHELNNIMYISPNLLNLSKKKQRIIT